MAKHPPKPTRKHEPVKKTPVRIKERATTMEQEPEIEIPGPTPEVAEPVSKKSEVKCECGEVALPNNHQCYRCSHRS